MIVAFPGHAHMLLFLFKYISHIISGRFDVGQNLCWSTYKMNWGEAMSLWSNETKDYQYGSSHGVSAVAHYTQVIN